MKESASSLSVEVDVVSPTTGEIIKINGITTEHSKYYSISKITSRINTMTLLTVMSKTTKSSKDIEILNHLLDKADRYNEVRLNVTKTAKELGVGRTKITTLLKAFQNEDFFYKLDVGVYLINSYVWVGRRVSSNELREKAQIRWVTLTHKGNEDE